MARLGRVILGAESESGSGERSGRDATEARERASTYDERGGGKVRRPAVALGDEIGAVGRAVKDWGRGDVRCLGDDSLRGFSSSVRAWVTLVCPIARALSLVPSRSTAVFVPQLLLWFCVAPSPRCLCLAVCVALYRSCYPPHTHPHRCRRISPPSPTRTHSLLLLPP